MDKRLKEVADLVAAFLVRMAGNEILVKWKEKRKISRILKDDSKDIKRVFFAIDNSDSYNSMEEFILFMAFKGVSFCSPFDLTMEQEENLWKKFSDFIKSETGDGYVNGEYKKKIIQCINFHNRAIDSMIMDSKDVIHVKVIQKHHDAIRDSLNGIVSTLNTETKLQGEGGELDFSVEQTEMVMKSCGHDLNQLRKMQVVSICGAVGLLLFISTFIPLSLRYVSNRYTVEAIFLFFIIVVVLNLVY